MARRQSPLIGTLEQTYADSLYDLANQAGRLADIADELAQIGRLIQAQPDLIKLMATHTLSVGERAGIIDRLFRGKMDDLLLGFFQVLNRKNRLGKLAGMIRAFELRMQERHGQVEVDAFLAQAMDEAAAQRLAAGLGRALSRQVRLQQYVDPQLIGGLKIRVGDRQIDGSVATQLRLVREKLVEVGRERARRLTGLVE